MEDVLDFEDVLVFVGRVEHALDLHYPNQAPWNVIMNEYLPNRPLRTRLYFQVSRPIGSRQPIHWDTGVPWMTNHNGKWAPLSVVVHINDGLSTYVSTPPADVFSVLREKYNQGVKPETLAESLESVLQRMETHSVPPKDLSRHKKSRAGQVLAFHAGEQAHAGTSWDGEDEVLHRSWHGRVVVYLFAVPESEKEAVWTLPLFNPEIPWGLMRAVTGDQVVF